MLTTTSGILLNGFGPSVTYLENDVNDEPRLLDSDVTFVATNSLAGGTLTVTQPGMRPGALPWERIVPGLPA